MTLEAKKYSLIQWIIAVADEKTISEIEKVKSLANTSLPAQSQQKSKQTYSPSSFLKIQSKTINVSQLKEEQRYRALSGEELDQVIADADVKETIDQLLKDLKEIG